MKIYFDGTYLENNPTWHQEDAQWKAEQIRKIIEKNRLHPKNICEVGCGSGEVLSRLSESFRKTELIGYEISPQAFDLCRKKSKPRLTFRLMDVLEGQSSRFDVVMAIDVIEHVEDYIGFLRGLRSKGEYKIFHIPLDLSVQTVLRSSPIMRTWQLLGHVHCFTKEMAIEALRDTGYEIVDYFYTGAMVDLPNRGWKANLLKIPRKIAFKINKDLTVRLFGGYSLLVLAR